MNFSDIPGDLTVSRKYEDPKRQAWTDLMFQIGPTYLFTFNYNRPMTIIGAQRAIQKWHENCDRKLLGDNFSDLKARRTTAVVVFEHVLTNLHAHGAVRTAAYRRIKSASEMQDIYRKAWKKQVPSGELHIAPADSRTIPTMLDYMTKERGRRGFYDDLMVL